MRRILQFSVSKGERKYVARGVDLPIVTQADTLDELSRNIQEAVDLYLEGENLEELGIAPSPSILMNFELVPSSR